MNMEKWQLIRNASRHHEFWLVSKYVNRPFSNVITYFLLVSHFPSFSFWTSRDSITYRGCYIFAFFNQQVCGFPEDLDVSAQHPASMTWGLQHPQWKKEENSSEHHQHNRQNHHELQCANVGAEYNGYWTNHNDATASHDALAPGLPGLISHANYPCKNDQNSYEHEQEPQSYYFHLYSIQAFIFLNIYKSRS